MLIGLNSLEKIIAESPDGKRKKIFEKCIDCGLSVQVEIHKTSGGYGLAGGALYDSSIRLCAKCPDCYKKNPKLNRTDQLKSGGAHGHALRLALQTGF
jgi:hypothetical protein